ncbi:MAG: hypothetical protein WC360_04850 [Opitutales bacterium]|jgi:hypothetical protein
MKSAYELALARMGIRGDDKPNALTDVQRAEISDIERRYSAKIAEREIFLRSDIEKARAAGDHATAEAAAETLRAERAELEEERELCKERIRRGDEG